MQFRNIAWVFFSFALIATASFAQQVSGRLPFPAGLPLGARSNTNYGTLPLTFEANQGQTSPQAKFRAHGAGYSAYFTAGGMVLTLRPAVAAQGNSTDSALSQNPKQRPGVAIQFTLLGANPTPVIAGEDQQPGSVNYFIGSDPTKWHRNIPTFAKVRYKNIYPGMDLVYYGSHQQLEYDFALSPGADPNQIQFAIAGADQVFIDTEGNLVLKVGGGELHFQCPIVYQESSGRRVAVDGRYIVKDPTHIGFYVAEHDQSQPLVIDPTLVYSTYLGGAGVDRTTGIAVDGAGSVYIAGYTDSADFLLTTLGAPATSANHIFVAKLDPTGSSLVYADYIGGNGEDYGVGLALDSANNAYVTGSTTSSNFPMVNPYQAVDPGPYSGFLSKISADGSSLLYSTYLGGNGFDEPAGIAVDTLGEAYIAGSTTSHNFPAVNAYQNAVLANQAGLYGIYGFVSKFSADGASLIYSTFLAGNSNVAQNCGTPCWPAPYTAVAAVALDVDGSAYVAGTTNTYNFPATSSAYLTSNSTQQDATVGFVSKLSSSGSLDYSTYFYGSSGAPIGIPAIAVDGTGSAYIAGTAFSDGTFPITSTGICDPSVYGPGCDYAFVTKFDPTGSTLLYSTFLGPNNYAFPQSLALDSNNNAYVLASSGSSVFVTQSGIEGYTNGVDMLLVEIDASAATELFATYLGASGTSSGSGMALDASGNMYVAGSTNAVDFPVSQGAFQGLLGGNTNAFVMKIGNNSAPAASLTPMALQYAPLLIGLTSQPQTVLLRNMGSASLMISSITLSGDFAETDNCGTSVPAAGACTFSVTFAPTAVGLRAGSIVVNDSAAGSPHLVSLSGTGLDALVGLTPLSLTFQNQQLGTSSSPLTVTVANTGTAVVSITGIQVTGDYRQTNNCPAALPVNSTCTISVTFTPTAPGARSGTLTVSDNAAGSPSIVSLSGTGVEALVTLTPLSLTFQNQQLGTSSSPLTVTVASTGTAVVSITGIQITGDYRQTNNCPAVLPVNSTCTISVTFAPTASGTRNGTLTISDNATGNPQSAGLTGSGLDFGLAGSPSSDTVKAGATATYTLTLSPLGGALNSAVQLACSGAPALTTCSLSQNSMTLGGSPATVTLSISTTASVAQTVPASPLRDHPIYVVWMQQGFGLFGMILVGFRARSKKLRRIVLLVLMSTALFVMSGCAGGTGITSQSGTTPGTYTITVTGASGPLQHSLPVTLIVR